MRSLRDYFRRWVARKHVRPWALLAPVVVLLICLPLLSPLRHPVATQMSEEEMARWATVQALVEQQTFAIDGTMFGHTRQRVRVAEVYYANQPPTQGLLLAGPYWVMVHGFGLHFHDDPALVMYLLTLVAVTVPVAAAAGMIYRMGRVFELTRPWRAGLALAVVLGSGMISYATVLNPFAPAAALILGAAAILVQVSRIRSPFRSGGYLASTGFFTALAAAIHPAAAPFVVLFAGVICVMRWRPSVRLGGVLMYGIGVIPPVLLHLSLSLPITGDWKLGLAPVSPHVFHLPHTPVVRPTPTGDLADEDAGLIESPSAWQTAGLYAGRVVGAAVGRHGAAGPLPGPGVRRRRAVDRRPPELARGDQGAGHRDPGRGGRGRRAVHRRAGRLAVRHVRRAVVRRVPAPGPVLGRGLVPAGPPPGHVGRRRRAAGVQLHRVADRRDRPHAPQRVRPVHGRGRPAAPGLAGGRAGGGGEVKREDVKT